MAFHSFLSPEDGEMVCSQIIETANKVVLVDAPLLRPYAKELRQYIDNLGKTLDRVIVTHSHPDHWFGLDFFEDVPIYALQEVSDEIEEVGDSYLAYKRSEHGEDLIADHKVVPSYILHEGTESIDGLKYVFTKITDAEAKLMLLIELPDVNTLLAQDLIYNDIHLYIGEKTSTGDNCFDGWLKVLKNLQEKDYDLVLSGHGFPTDSSIFPKMIKYIEDAKQIFGEIDNGDELKQKILEKYPSYRVPSMVDTSVVFLFDLFPGGN